MAHDLPPTSSAATPTTRAMPAMGGTPPVHDMSKMGAAAPMDHDLSEMSGTGANAAMTTHGERSGHQLPPGTPPPAVAKMTIVSFAALATGILLAIVFSKF
jgi:hypothetical protein